MHPEVMAAQAQTLRQWSEMWGRLDIIGSVEMQKSLAVAAAHAEAIISGAPLPEAVEVLPAMPQLDTLRDG